MEIVQVNPQEFGLTDELAKNIKDQFQPMLDKMVELEGEFNEVVNLPIEEPETSKRAKELRQKYVKVRTGTSDIHKKQKAFYLNGGRFVDGWKNAQIFASQGKEEALEQIEKHQELKEKAKIEALQNDRVDMIRPYVDDVTSVYFGNMDADVWDAYYNAKKKAYEDRMELERKVKEERMIQEAKLKVGADRKSKIMQSGLWGYLQQDEMVMDFSVMTDKYYDGLLVTLNLRKENEEKDKQRIREENERIKREQLELQRKLEAERLEAEAERKRLRDELDKKEKEFREAERLKQLEEEKARKEAIKLAKAPIKKQLKSWVDSFTIPEYVGKENELSADIESKFMAFKNWAITQIDNL